MDCATKGIASPTLRSTIRRSSHSSACATTSLTRAFTSVPALASPGIAAPSFAPGVQMVDKSYSPPRSWRGNLFWGSAWKSFNYTVEGTLSLNLDQPGTEDLNFSGTPRFSLAGENRPMFVQPSDIVGASGLVAS